MKRIVVLFLSITVCFHALSQSDTTELLPVEVRAVRAPEGSPITRTNLNAAEIRKLNTGQDLPFLLNRTPSVVVNSDAGNGVGYTGIRIRGTDATRINVTLNGIPFNDAESQGTFFVDLPDFASSVNSIQIQRGVGTSSHGAGAFGATIAMSTNEVKQKAYGEFNNSYGSFNTLKNTLKVGTGLLGNRFTIDGRLSRIVSDGYIDRAESDLKSFYFSTAFVTDQTKLRFNAFSGKEKTYQSWYGVSEKDLKENRTVNYAGTERPGDPYDDETDNYQQDHYQLFFDQKLWKHWSFNTAVFLVKGKGYYNQYKAQESYSDYGLPDVMFNGQLISESDVVRRLWLDNDFYGNIFSLQHKSPLTEVMIGGAITNYKGDHFGEVVWAEKGMPAGAQRWYDVPAEKKDLSFYSKGLFHLSKKLKFFGDLQWRHVDYRINGFRDNPELLIHRTYDFWNPKLGLTILNGNLRGYASYSIANKEPNRDDFEAGSDQTPVRERLHDWEVGVENKKQATAWSANLYYMKYKDQLVLTGKINDVGAYTRTNIPNSYRLGVEVEGRRELNEKLFLTGNITVSRNRIKDLKEFIDDYDNGGQKLIEYDETPISFSPAVTGLASVSWSPIDFLQLELTGKYVSRQYLDNTGNDARSLDGHYVQDFRISKELNKKWWKNATVYLNVNNVLNKKYEPNGYTFSYIYSNELVTENYYFPMAGINWMVGVNLSF